MRRRKRKRNERALPDEPFELPLAAIVCPYCARELSVSELSLLETLWMHEYDCRGIAALTAPAAAA